MSPNMHDDPIFSALPSRLEALRARIADIDRNWTNPVRIVAVTKGFDHRAVDAAAAAGCDAIGENYGQEIVAKRESLEGSDLDLHFIGHLQSNKIRQLTDLVSVWSTIDRPSVIDELAKRSPGAAIHLQVNTTGEAHKGGCAADEVGDLIALFRSDLDGLNENSQLIIYNTIVQVLKVISGDPLFPTMYPSDSDKDFDKSSREDYAARWIEWFANHN